MIPEGVTPEAPKEKVAETTAQQESKEPATLQPVGQATVPAKGKRIAFGEIRRQLTEEELKQPGVQKILIEDFERAEAQCENLEAYVERFHEADKLAAVLESKVRVYTALDIYFGVGLSMGGVIIGLSPVLWDATEKGPLALGVGIVLLIGSTVGRIVQVRR